MSPDGRATSPDPVYDFARPGPEYAWSGAAASAAAANTARHQHHGTDAQDDVYAVVPGKNYGHTRGKPPGAPSDTSQTIKMSEFGEQDEVYVYDPNTIHTSGDYQTRGSNAIYDNANNNAIYEEDRRGRDGGTATYQGHRSPPQLHPTATSGVRGMARQLSVSERAKRLSSNATQNGVPLTGRSK